MQGRRRGGTPATRRGRDDLATPTIREVRSSVIREACWFRGMVESRRGRVAGLPACREHPLFRNLLVRKLDPPQTWNPMVENYLRATGFYHVSKIGIIHGFHPLLSALVERWRPETHTFVMPVDEITVTLEDVAYIFGLPIDGEAVSGWTDNSADFVRSQSYAIFGREPEVSTSSKSYIKLAWVRRVRDVEPLDTEDSIRRYVRCHIFCLLGSNLFADKSTAYAHAKYLPLLRDFDQIHTYSWGSACLAHLYRALCRASRFDTKEMDGPLNLLFVWAWERMPCIAPVPRNTLPPVEIPVAKSHSVRTTAWSSNTVVTFRHHIDYMQELHGHLDVCDTVAPLLSFECIEWHPVDRVMRQFGYAQPTPQGAREIPLDLHCMALRGAKHSAAGSAPPSDLDFSPTTEYRDWYLRSYGYLLRLSEYVPQDPQPHVPQSPAPQEYVPQQPQPDQHVVFQLFPYYVPQPLEHSQGSQHSQQSESSHQRRYSQHGQHSQESHHSQVSHLSQQPILTIPSSHDSFEFSVGGHGDQQQ
ncbi:uncharacterized protein DS421_10g305790 [Arachis hypogaea]|nr:uncharacterized protein DS421_10g305790 [Arachis hypogaea]